MPRTEKGNVCIGRWGTSIENRAGPLDELSEGVIILDWHEDTILLDRYAGASTMCSIDSFCAWHT